VLYEWSSEAQTPPHRLHAMICMLLVLQVGCSKVYASVKCPAFGTVEWHCAVYEITGRAKNTFTQDGFPPSLPPYVDSRRTTLCCSPVPSLTTPPTPVLGSSFHRWSFLTKACSLAKIRYPLMVPTLRLVCPPPALSLPCHNPFSKLPA
jgi:hypothetical protein